MSTGAVARIATIVVITTILMIGLSADVLLVWQPYSTYGFTLGPTGAVATTDEDARALGLHEGDRIDLARWSVEGRGLDQVSAAPRGSRLSIPRIDKASVIVTAHPRKRVAIDNITDVLDVVTLIIGVVLAGVLVLLRPSLTTWSFYILNVGLTGAGENVHSLLPAAIVIPYNIFFSVMSVASAYAFVLFAVRFPDERPTGMLAAIERFTMWFGSACVTFTFGGYLLYVYAGLVPALYGLDAMYGLCPFVAVAGVIILLTRFLRAPIELKNRIRWILVGFSAAYLPYFAMQNISNLTGIGPPIWVFNAALVLEVIGPIALAYAILRHRLFDIRLFVSRAFLYATLTTFTIGVLALADWILGKWLASSRLTIVAEIALALVIGYSLTTMHRRFERFLNGVVFRAQAVALETLRRFAREMDLIADPHRLIVQTCEILRMQIASEYVGIYTADGTAFVLETAPSHGIPTLLPADDFNVLRLRRWQEPFQCEVREHALVSALLVPMTVRGQLIGFIAAGPKRDHTRYLPEEIETLTSVAHHCGLAYGWLMRDGNTTAIAVSSPTPRHA